MRTTLRIDDDVFRAAQAIARGENRTVGEVLSELARRALAPRPPSRRRGFPTFEVPEDARPITGEMVRRALEET